MVCDVFWLHCTHCIHCTCNVYLAGNVLAFIISFFFCVHIRLKCYEGKQRHFQLNSTDDIIHYAVAGCIYNNHDIWNIRTFMIQSAMRMWLRLNLKQPDNPLRSLIITFLFVITSKVPLCTIDIQFYKLKFFEIIEVQNLN